MAISASSPRYTRAEAKEWAQASLTGVCNVLTPSFTADLQSLNVAGIRHDVARCAELGFTGALVVAESGTTLAEYCELLDIVLDSREHGFQALVHGSFDTLDETIEACRYGAARGADAVLPALPPSDLPRPGRGLPDYLERLAQATDLAIVAPGQTDRAVLERLATIETVVAIKYEAKHPAAGMAQIQRVVGERLVVCDSMEFNAPGWINAYGMQWMGTSGYEYYGERVPAWFAALRTGDWDSGMELYWSMQPAREARGALHASIAGAKLLPRPAWKYMGWLQGFNGGPVRMPQMRLDGATMQRLRAGLERSGYQPSEGSDADFFGGRQNEQ